VVVADRDRLAWGEWAGVLIPTSVLVFQIRGGDEISV
jgi:hypothetical protein